jgi:hypothetical protein
VVIPDRADLLDVIKRLRALGYHPHDRWEAVTSTS